MKKLEITVVEIDDQTIWQVSMRTEDAKGRMRISTLQGGVVEGKSAEALAAAALERFGVLNGR